MNSQDKFTAAMAALAEERRLDLVVDHSWANRGHYAFQPHGSFSPLLRFPFDFQPDYSSFTGDTGHSLGSGPKGGSWSYVQGAEHDLLVERVAEVLNSLGALPNPPEPDGFEAALEAFKLAARHLDQAWSPEDEVEGYPAYLPDFSEFVVDLGDLKVR